MEKQHEDYKSAFICYLFHKIRKGMETIGNSENYSEQESVLEAMEEDLTELQTIVMPRRDSVGHKQNETQEV